ncbi:hypothetical protein EG329_009987 [Mollisiaceae sp. DMI_Dod_QoI]|nr:hypothetical protein EG329_009987 [Helotiales sp. DMI_Dod_QoI]
MTTSPPASQDHLDSANITTQEHTSFQMFEVLPRLYISKFPTTIPPNITHILNMCTHPHPKDTTRNYLHIALDDIDNITPHIPSILSFIDTALKDDGTVLVHCALGLNRSAAAVLAFLCHQKEMTSLETLKYLKERKPNVRPSALFMQQINQYFGRKEGEDVEDPMARFHRRLQERKAGIVQSQ